MSCTVKLSKSDTVPAALNSSCTYVAGGIDGEAGPADADTVINEQFEALLRCEQFELLKASPSCRRQCARVIGWLATLAQRADASAGYFGVATARHASQASGSSNACVSSPCAAHSPCHGTFNGTCAHWRVLMGC
eukprot:2753695-Prymnesium_polylepis.4